MSKDNVLLFVLSLLVFSCDEKNLEENNKQSKVDKIEVYETFQEGYIYSDTIELIDSSISFNVKKDEVNRIVALYEYNAKVERYHYFGLSLEITDQFLILI